jgi:Outer membrane protein beta-barrel domain
MKKLVSMALLVFLGHAVFAQSDSTKTTKKKASYTSTQSDSTKTGKKKVTYASLNLANRANDHFMIEFSYDNWVGKTDSMNTSGFSRGFAMYFMYDLPFKSDPHFSVGAGIGINASNIFFDKTEVLVADPGNQTLAFPNTANTDHFKKYKLVITNLEVPLELRYAFNPENTNKSWKIALGFKAGFMLSAYTKGKDLENQAGQVINSYIEKKSSKDFFNGGRVVGTARVNYGWIGVFGQLQLTPLIKNGAGPTINPYSIGLVLSGL